MNVNLSNQFCSLKQVEKIISMLSSRGCHYQSFISDLNTLFRVPSAIIANTLGVLQAAMVVRFDSKNIYLISNDFKPLIRTLIYQEKWLNRIANSFVYKLDNSINIDIYRLPNDCIYLHQILSIAGIVNFEGQKLSRYISISNDFHKTFSKVVEDINKSYILPKRVLSPAQLEEINKLKSEAGFAAEMWVYGRESIRLKGHIFSESIKMISQEDVSSGFDIASFNSVNSLFYDRLIEVKSYVGNPRIYMSSNEVDAAERYAEKYVLVIVDRARIDEPGYTPREYINPYKLFFSGDKPDWVDISTSNYLISFNL